MPLVPNNTRRKMLAGEVALGFGVHHLRSAAAPVLPQPRAMTGCFSTTSTARSRCTRLLSCALRPCRRV